MITISRRGFLKGSCLAVSALALGDWWRETERLLAAPPAGPEDFLPQEEMNRILARALERGGHYADLFVENRVRTHIRIVDSRIESLEYGVLQGGGVRTLAGERSGYAYTESLDPAALTAAASTAAEIASAGQEVGPVPVSSIDVPRYIVAREAIDAAGIPAKVALLERADRSARAVDPAVKQVTVDYTDEVQRFAIATASGQLGYDELPIIYFRVTVTAERDGERAEGASRASQRAGMEFMGGDHPERAGREAAEQAMRLLDAVPAPTGEMPVVVAAGGGVMFHEAVGHGLEADAIIRDTSVFAGRSGEMVASELVTLYDDAAIPNARGSFNIDDEATPAAKTLLIDRGRLVSYMQDRRTAHAMGMAATANGRRQSFRYPPMVRMTNTYVAPGRESPEEIIKATPRGVYAVHFGGGEVDTGSGQFTFGLREAYLIEDGKVTAPIKGANLVGAGIEVLERIDRVGSDYGSWPGTCGKGDQWVPVTSGCPTLRISRITVGGTT
ncbi:MAG: TldD/PmbA family protein [Candidatus Eisenbacteria sp.]|nr:TldD/PmbA family protein [Candidatus Eisenbacteria bacterium]